MTKETAKRRIPLIRQAIKLTKASIKEARLNGNNRAEEAHKSYLETCKKSLKDAEQRLRAFV